MSITDELREYFGKSKGMFTDHVLAIADRIDVEHEKACAESWMRGHDVWASVGNDDKMAELGWARLPKDADGEVIHIGDVMEYGKARGRVIALMLSNYPKKWGGELHWGIQLEGEHAPTALDGFFRHYHATTVEDVLREMLKKWGDAPWDDDTDDESIVAEYAAKLRLADDEEDE